MSNSTSSQPETTPQPSYCCEKMRISVDEKDNITRVEGEPWWEAEEGFEPDINAQTVFALQYRVGGVDGWTEFFPFSFCPFCGKSL